MKWRVVVLAMVVVCVVGLLMSVEGKAQSKSPTKHEDIRKLLELTGAGTDGMQVMNQMITVVKQGNTGIPDKFWEDFMAETDANELVEMTIPIYAKYLTHDEIKKLINFYETPLGRKLIAVQPKMMQESIIAGQQWGSQLAEKVASKLREDAPQPPVTVHGYDLEKPEGLHHFLKSLAGVEWDGLASWTSMVPDSPEKSAITAAVRPLLGTSDGLPLLRKAEEPDSAVNSELQAAIQSLLERSREMDKSPKAADYAKAVRELDRVIHGQAETYEARIARTVAVMLRDWCNLLFENEQRVSKAVEAAVAQVDRHMGKGEYEQAMQRACEALRYRRKVSAIRMKMMEIGESYRGKDQVSNRTAGGILAEALRKKDAQEQVALLAQALLYEYSNDVLRELDKNFNRSLSPPKLEDLTESLIDSPEQKAKVVAYLSSAGDTEEARQVSWRVVDATATRMRRRAQEIHAGAQMSFAVAEAVANGRLERAREVQTKRAWREAKDAVLNCQKTFDDCGELLGRRDYLERVRKQLAGWIRECEDALSEDPSVPDRTGPTLP